MVVTGEKKYAIGVDLGGTKIEIGMIDERGHLYRHERILTAKTGAESVEFQIKEQIDSLQRQMGVAICGVGIGVAGQVDHHTGEIFFAPNLNWRNISLQKNMEAALQLPVYVLNDVRAITWGEWLYGAGKGIQDLLCIFVGTGIGSGVISGGHFLHGHSNTFGEIGHMTVDFNGPLCTCGKRGCLEAFSGGWGIGARAKDAILSDRNQEAGQILLQLVNHQINDISAQQVIEAYHQGDLLALEILENSMRALVAGIASAVNVLNPRRLVLGGGVIDGLPEMIEWIEKGVKNNALASATTTLEIVRSSLGKQVGVIGAAAALFHKLRVGNTLE